MRIVQVCPYSWTARGGVQTHVRNLAAHLSHRGHDVLVLAAGPLTPGRSAMPDIAVGAEGSIRAPGLRLIGSSIRVPFNGSLAPICLQSRGMRAVREALLEFQPDVVHVHEPFVPGISVSAVWWSPAPVVATFHAYCPSPLDATLCQLYTQCLWPIRRRLALRLSVSRAAASGAAARGRGVMHIVPNGVDVEAFSEPRPTPSRAGRKLLFVGRLDRRKGFAVALRAFARLSERYDDLVFMVAGTGPQQCDADRLPGRLRRRIVLLGDVEDETLPSIYADADVFVAPAIGGESFGTVLLEAMASGRAIVASDIAGYREVVRAGQDALLVPPGNAERLANAVGLLLDDPALAGRLQGSARERAQQFAWTRVTDAVEQAYRGLVRTDVVLTDAHLARSIVE